MKKTDEYRYSLHVYDGLKCRATTLLGFTWRPPSVSVGYAGTPALLTSFRIRNKPLGLFLWEQRYPAPIMTYNKSRYLAVHSSSAPDTPWSLSRASTGPILSMVHRSLSVFNNLVSGLYGEICGMDAY